MRNEDYYLSAVGNAVRDAPPRKPRPYAQTSTCGTGLSHTDCVQEETRGATLSKGSCRNKPTVSEDSAESIQKPECAEIALKPERPTRHINPRCTHPHAWDATRRASGLCSAS